MNFGTVSMSMIRKIWNFLRRMYGYFLGFASLYNVLLISLFSEELRLIATISGWNHVGVTTIYDLHLPGAFYTDTVFYYFFYWLDRFHFKYSVVSIFIITFLLTVVVFGISFCFILIAKKIIDTRRGFKIVE